jgi:hypothetical protein
MAPDRNPKRTPKKKLAINNGEFEKRTRPSPYDQHQIVFFQRHILDDINESTLAQVPAPLWLLYQEESCGPRAFEGVIRRGSMS